MIITTTSFQCVTYKQKGADFLQGFGTDALNLKQIPDGTKRAVFPAVFQNIPGGYRPDMGQFYQIVFCCRIDIDAL